MNKLLKASEVGTNVPLNIPLRTILNTAAAVCAILAFFMGKELVGAPYAWGFLVLMTAAFFIEWQNLPHPPRFLINLATLAALGVIFTRIRRNYVIEALMESLLLMIAVKMLEDKKPRDYAQIVLLNLAAVVCYAMLAA